MNNVEDSGLATDKAEQDNSLEPGNDQYQVCIQILGTFLSPLYNYMLHDLSNRR